MQKSVKGHFFTEQVRPALGSGYCLVGWLVSWLVGWLLGWLLGCLPPSSTIIYQPVPLHTDQIPPSINQMKWHGLEWIVGPEYTFRVDRSQFFIGPRSDHSLPMSVTD